MYSFRNGIWQCAKKACSSSIPPSSSSIILAPIRIALYNVLFDHINTEMYGGINGKCNDERFHHQINSILPSLNADIIGLNEANPHFLKIALETPWIQEGYEISQIETLDFEQSSRSSHLFGNVFLLKKNEHIQVKKITKFKFPSYWRSALLMELEIKINELQSMNISLLLCHLKAGNGQDEIENRKLQFKTIEKYFENNNQLILVLGDLNIVDSVIDKEYMPIGFNDLYLNLFKQNNLDYCSATTNTTTTTTSINGPSLEFTFDGKYNKLIGDEDFRKRFDRIYYKKPNNLKMKDDEIFTQMKLFGVEHLKDDESPLHDKPASDHYGVYFDLQFNK